MELFVHSTKNGEVKRRLRRSVLNYLFYSMIASCIIGILFSIICTINNLKW